MMEKTISTQTIENWKSQNPVLQNISDANPVFWINDYKPTTNEANEHTHLTQKDVEDAEDRFARFASFLKVAFPETEAADGIIESGLTEIKTMKKELESYYDTTIEGSVYLKRDDTLPIAGTIKARGAIYEVLKHAETLAIEHGLLQSIDQDYKIFNNNEFKEFFGNYKIVVGTTGNLGISVGVMGAKLGFNVTVHMSVEAKDWKKNLLRSRGVTVIEHKTSFTKAVENGREESEQDPSSYFIDDEHSGDLFLGYTVAGNRLKKQLEERNIKVDENHPLFLYLPCGIGGSPGGITFGLKQIYGDNVHCFFAEPTHMPSMLLGLLTGKYDGITIDDFSIDGSKTFMDGLAVPRTSGFVAGLMHNYFDGGFTVEEDDNFKHLANLIDTESIPLEPAAVAGVPGPARLFKTEAGRKYIKSKGLTDNMSKATHISWATGGSMVPESDMQDFYNEGKKLD